MMRPRASSIFWIFILYQFPLLIARSEEFPENFFKMLSKGISFDLSGTCDYPESGRKFQVETGDDIGTFVHDFEIAGRFLDDGATWRKIEKDAYGNEVWHTDVGVAGSLYYALDIPRKVMAVGTGTRGAQIAANEMRGIDLFTYPFCFFSGRDFDPITPSIPNLAELADMMESVAASLSKSDSSTVKLIQGEYEWVAKFGKSKIYPESTIITKGKSDVVAEFTVSKWTSVGELILPAEVEQRLFIDGVEVRKIAGIFLNYSTQNTESIKVPYSEANRINDRDAGAVFER